MSTLASNPLTVLQSATEPESLAELLDAKRTRSGLNLATLSLASPVLVLFLRHAGCTFCREALSDLSECRAQIEATGTTIVVVHLSDPSPVEGLLVRYKLADLDRIHDPSQALYRAFGLKQGNWWQLGSPLVWWRGVRSTLKHGGGRPHGDIKQLPGLFLLDRCEVVRSFRHSSAADRPLYAAFVQAGLKKAKS